MASSTLPVALSLVFGDEGGYSNHPKDPGGPTKFGITHRTLAAARGVPSVSAAQVKALTKDEAAEIYRAGYWGAIRGDDLPRGLDYAALDFAVHSGPAQAVKELQRLVGVTADGIMGPQTLAAIARRDVRALIRAYCDARMAFLRRLKTWATFGRGWTIRVTGVDPKGQYARKPGVVGHALELAAGGTGAAPVQPPVPAGKANPAGTRATATAEGKGATVAGASALGAACAEAAQQLAPLSDALEVAKWIFLALTLAGIGFGLLATVRRIREGNA